MEEKVILVVDDSPLAPCAVREVLVPLGYKVERAVNEADALDKLANASIALVLVDMRTPCASGLEVVRALSDIDDSESQVPVVILSAEGQPHLIEKARNAGVAAWLVKPFDPNLFATAINGYCRT